MTLVFVFLSHLVLAIFAMHPMGFALRALRMPSSPIEVFTVDISLSSKVPCYGSLLAAPARGHASLAQWSSVCAAGGDGQRSLLWSSWIQLALQLVVSIFLSPAARLPASERDLKSQSECSSMIHTITPARDMILAD